ncbi:alkaline phosphatase family protein, partial [Haliangium sp.]|uniref:alkaline phosphatase family protein n=1 Tax=Haliangium sp. TaxID=2663208 RepID=UPI003D0AD6A1
MPHARPTSPSPPARPAQALLLVAAAALAATCGPAPPGPPQPAASTAPTGPRLVVLVVVDQLPSWSFAPVLARSRDGFARLRDHGVYYPEAEVPYATTYTSSGHAALGTGAPPALTGVLDNGWYRPEQGTVRSATHDPDSPVFQLAPVEPGRHGGHGRSGTALRVDGLAEMLARARGGRARSVSISLKDRAAAFVAGRHPDLAVWYDDDQAAMTTSRFYAPTLPPWLRALHEQGLVASRLDWVWTPLPELDHLALTGGPDVAPGESTGDLLGPGFPHDLARSPAPATA